MARKFNIPPEQIMRPACNLAAAVGEASGFLSGISTEYQQLPKHVRHGASEIAKKLEAAFSELRIELEAMVELKEGGE